MHPCAVMRMRRKITFHIYREFEENIPSYVGDIVKDNRRQHTNLAQVINSTLTFNSFILNSLIIKAMPNQESS